MRKGIGDQKDHEMDQRHRENNQMIWRILYLDISLCSFFLSFLVSSRHEATSEDKEACWSCMEDFGREGERLAEVGIIVYEGLGSLGSAFLKVFSAK